MTCSRKRQRRARMRLKTSRWPPLKSRRKPTIWQPTARRGRGHTAPCAHTLLTSGRCAGGGSRRPPANARAACRAPRRGRVCRAAPLCPGNAFARLAQRAFAGQHPVIRNGAAGGQPPPAAVIRKARRRAATFVFEPRRWIPSTTGRAPALAARAGGRAHVLPRAAAQPRGHTTP